MPISNTSSVSHKPATFFLKLQLTPCRLWLIFKGRALVRVGSQVLIEPTDEVAHLDGVVLAALAPRVSGGGAQCLSAMLKKSCRRDRI